MPKKLTEKAFSRNKVEPFFVNTTDIQGYYKYRDNIVLSSQFYTPLFVFEITLRNALSKGLGRWRNRKRICDWELFLSQKNIDSDIYTKDNEQKTLKKLAYALFNCRFSAFPSLGFYTRLTNHTNANMFQESIILPMLNKLFITESATQNELINKMHSSLDKIRLFRNRLCHYESLVTKFTEIELRQIADDIYYFIENLNPEAFEWISIEFPLDDFKIKISDLYTRHLRNTVSPIEDQNN